MSVVLYDTFKVDEHRSCSMNTWRIRLILNYKKITFTTVWLPYKQIDPAIRALPGAQPTIFLPDGRTIYTVPTITHDGHAVSDSLRIAQYLDAAFPESPLFPPGTHALQAFFASEFDSNGRIGLFNAVAPMGMAHVRSIQAPEDGEYMESIWKKQFGISIDELYTPATRPAVRARVEAAFSALEGIMARTGADGGIFIGGERPIYADIILAAGLIGAKLGIGNAEEWEWLISLNGGRWRRFLDAICEIIPAGNV
ncbi:hypothetical protein AURDEDRAFT_156140 [Auricularia subglabra TFB-10046 SS5]|nr:hypothetical protein AURDEDRAFT_156140 [Auricularia subglabra TFB-10046 SS5]